MNTNKFLDKKSDFIIAIDGEAASGKGTLSKKIADEYSFFYCQTSLFYRRLAYLVITKSLSKQQDVIDKASNFDDLYKVAEKFLYSEEVSKKASEIASIPEVRKALNIPQKEILHKHKRILMEGRDIGIVIAPSADIKLYIKADVEIRAKRRYEQQLQSGRNVEYINILNDLIDRDRRDKERKEAPLSIARDAIIIDNSNLHIDEFYDKAVDLINSKLEK